MRLLEEISKFFLLINLLFTLIAHLLQAIQHNKRGKHPKLFKVVMLIFLKFRLFIYIDNMANLNS